MKLSIVVGLCRSQRRTFQALLRVSAQIGDQTTVEQIDRNECGVLFGISDTTSFVFQVSGLIEKHCVGVLGTHIERKTGLRSQLNSLSQQIART